MLRDVFSQVQDKRVKKVTYSMPDTLMACFAMFNLKYPAMLCFDNEASFDLRYVFQSKVATDSRRKLPPIPREGCHPFQSKAATLNSGR